MPAPLSPALFDQFARGWRGYLLIALIALASALMGARSVPVTDSDEAQIALASGQQVESGGGSLREQRARAPGIHWLHAGALFVTAPFAEELSEIWRYRLVSALGLVLAGLAVLWAGSALFDERAAMAGAAFFAVGVLASAEGMLATSSAITAGFTTLTMAALAYLRVGTPHPRIFALIFWAALACGALVGGPIPPITAALALATLFVWERRVAWTRPLAWWPGPLLATALAAPWLLTLGMAPHGGEGAHPAVPGYHLLWLPLLIFPATYTLPAAARLGLRAVRAPVSDETQAPLRFLIAWAAPIFVFFELLPDKLIHYALPAYPAIALLCGAGLFAARGRRWRTTHPAGVVLFAVAGAIIVALMAAVATFVPGDTGAGLRRALATGVIGALVLAAAIAGLLSWRRPTARAAVLVVCALVFCFSLRERLLPDARGLFVSEEAVTALKRERLFPADGAPFWAIGYSEPSLAFLTPGALRSVSAEEAATQARDGETMIVERRALEGAEAALAAHGLVFEAADAPARGMAIGRGAHMTLYVGRVRATTGEQADARQPNP